MNCLQHEDFAKQLNEKFPQVNLNLLYPEVVGSVPFVASDSSVSLRPRVLLLVFKSEQGFEFRYTRPRCNSERMLHKRKEGKAIRELGKGIGNIFLE